jgi:putative transposase
MSRFRKLSPTIWHCQYHIVWVPKYRYRILTGRVAEEVGRCLRAFAEQQQSEVVELKVQIDHVHRLVRVPPKGSLSDVVGTVKGRTAIRVFNQFRELKRRPYWGNRFWARGYGIDTVGLDETKIRAYVQYQEKRERQAEQRGLDF